MDTKTKKLIENGTVPELSQLKAQAADVLKNNPIDKDAMGIVEAVNDELEARAKAEPPKVKVRAKNFVTVDGQQFQKDQEGTITAGQYAALACNFVKLGVAALVLGALLLLGSPASAQQYKLDDLGVTNTIAPAVATTSNIGATNACTKWETFGLQATFKCDGATTDNLTLSLLFSADGTNFGSALGDRFTWVIPENGTTAVCAQTNLSSTVVGNFGWWKVSYITNANSTYQPTNFVLRRFTKPVRNGP
jgi:hypothetical protein